MVLKTLSLSLFFLLQQSGLLAQSRILSEAKLEYAITINGTSTKDELAADTIERATLTIWMRGNQVRLDFTSKLRQQSTFYSNTEKNGVIIKFAGTEQFITELDAAQWNKYFYKTKVMKVVTLSTDEKQGGYNCEKLQLTRNDSTQVTLFITKQLVPLVKGYEPMFELLDGIPVSYTYKVNGYLIKYQLKNIETIPISTARFEVPKLSYKVLEYPKDNGIKKAYQR